MPLPTIYFATEGAELTITEVSFLDRAGKTVYFSPNAAQGTLTVAGSGLETLESLWTDATGLSAAQFSNHLESYGVSGLQGKAGGQINIYLSPIDDPISTIYGGEKFASQPPTVNLTKFSPGGSPITVTGSDPGVDGYLITKDDDTVLSPPTRALWVGTGGTVIVRMVGGTVLTFTNVADGTLLPVRVDKVISTSNTASGFVGLY